MLSTMPHDIQQRALISMLSRAAHNRKALFKRLSMYRYADCEQYSLALQLRHSNGCDDLSNQIPAAETSVQLLIKQRVVWQQCRAYLGIVSLY